MTLTTEALKWIKAFFAGRQCFFPRDSAIPGEYPPEISRYCKILWVDILIYIRNIVADASSGETVEFDKDDIESLMENLAPGEDLSSVLAEILESNGSGVKTFGALVRILFSVALRVLRDKNSTIDTVVLRLDLVGKSPLAKSVGNRYKQVEEYPVPSDGSNPFHDNLKLPPDINSLFKTQKCRVLFYKYITNHFVSKIKSMPNGRRIILDGGILGNDDEIQFTPPLIIEGRPQGHKITARYMPDEWTTFQGESDLGVFEWIDRFGNQPMIISSDDGDIMLAALLRWSRGTLTQPHLYMRKKYVLRTEELKGAKLRAALEKKKTNSRTRTTRSVFEKEYINLTNLAKAIIEHSVWYGESLELCPYPIESLCVLCFMCGNDFVDGKTFPNIGFTTLWRAFTENIKRFGKMVTRDETNDRYGIDREIFEDLIYYLFCKRFPGVNKTYTPSNLEEFLGAYDKYKQGILALPQVPGDPKKKIYDMPSIGKIRGSQANIAWTLEYFGNGEHSLIGSHCMDKDVIDGTSLYGFAFKDESGGTGRDNIIHSENMAKRVVYWSKYA